MSDFDQFFGPNAGYAIELYDKYWENPDSVDPATRAIFEHWNPNDATVPSAHVEVSHEFSSSDINKIVASARVARLVRECGHMEAKLDPLGSTPPGDTGLQLVTHGLETSDLARLPASVIGGPLSDHSSNALEALGKLRLAYSGSIGIETSHVQSYEERKWIRLAVETGRFFLPTSADEKRELLDRLTEVDTLEQFLHKTYVGAKWFSVEGTDMVVPMLDLIIQQAATEGAAEVVMGMAHRGRLNVLAHILGKPYAAILQAFEKQKPLDSASVSGGGQRGYTGDVKYHLGFRRSYSEHGVKAMPITLTPNPSHLEFVNPVVLGRARAAQERRDLGPTPQRDVDAALSILLHGDAAFPGEGIVAETMNLGQLPGYQVGGTIHIILNNQIGFTTEPRDSRSTLYASDPAKGFEIPIVHVNADDPLACLAVSRMAIAYRNTFHKDFLIDLVGYRRFGHNELEEPAFTQPQMYSQINAHPRVREIWANQLEVSGIVTRDESTEMVEVVRRKLQAARTEKVEVHHDEDWVAISEAGAAVTDVATAVSEERLETLNSALLSRPEGFTPNGKLENILKRRGDNFRKPNGIDWGHAESLAFASILEDATPIRITGQDSERGTFGHRNLVLHDLATARTYCPMQSLPQAKASFAVYNSALSEAAVLGFEYGYSVHAKNTLVFWEAQFGDFVNSAQVILDQFVCSGIAKWHVSPSMVMLLPHGYEGQGPEHSSARIERFLQSCANDNMRVVYCSNSAQYFHVLRRQASILMTSPRPLVIFTPKSLLRLPEASCSLSDLTEGSFQPVMNDPTAEERKEIITRVVLCTGKVAIDLLNTTAYQSAANVAVVRLEELYPFPYRELESVFAGFPELREIVWMQEEPHNMGAWGFVNSQIRQTVGHKYDLRYVGRPASASPAVGSMDIHRIEQANILAAAVSSAPEPTLRRSEATNVR